MPDATSKDADSELILGLLRAVQNNDALTQRSAARELGVALGLVNTYLKRCVKKGFIKVTQAPSSRYVYYLTPKGFAEKSRLTAEFLTQSLSLFRQAQREYQDILEQCEVRELRRIALHGASDLAEIITLYARDYDLEIVGVVDAHVSAEEFPFLPIHKDWRQLKMLDAHVVTELRRPQQAYDRLVSELPPEKVLVPKLLEVIEKTASPEDGS